MNAHFLRGRLLFEQGRLEMAEEELRQAVGEEPGDVRPLALLALCLARREEHPEAVRTAREAVGHRPDLALTHSILARVLRASGDLPEAEAAVREAIRIDPDDPEHRTVLATILAAAGRWEASLAAADEARTLDPDDATAGNLRSLCLQKLGRSAAAVDEAERVLSLEPDNASGHANLGWSWLRRGEHREAAGHFREALRLDPGSDWAREGMVESLEARYLLYRVLLRFFFWMDTLSSGARMAVIFGGYFAIRVLRNVARDHEALAPVITPLVVAYGLFAVMTWIGSALFDLLLRLHPDGKLALRRRDIFAADLVGGLLAVAVVLAVVGALGGGVRWLTSAMVLGSLAIPMPHAIRQPPSSSGRRWRLAAATLAILAALVIAGVLGGVFAGSGPALGVYALALVGYLWAASISSARSPR